MPPPAWLPSSPISPMMESFSAEWLALREPADHAARAPEVMAAVTTAVARTRGTRAVDLAGGAGSSIRYLLPRLPHIRQWTLVDHDTALLETARRTLEPLAQSHDVDVETVRLDLMDLDALPLADCALVTASALLDLVSAAWLHAFARRCRQAQPVVLCALTYDGRIACDPRQPLDDRVRDLVNAHQRTDKGFGPALGPDAVAAARRAFAGWQTFEAASDWQLGAEHAELQRQLVRGWAGAAREMAPPTEVDDIDRWLERRRTHIDAGSSHLVVGHLDFAAVAPPG
jgi:hypothetical protein